MRLCLEGVSLQSGFMFVSDSVPRIRTVIFFSNSLHIASSLLSCTFEACIFPMRKENKFFFPVRAQVEQTNFLDLLLCCLLIVFSLSKLCLKMQSLEKS